MEETEKIKALLEKYYDGTTSVEEERVLTQYFQQPHDLGELEAHRAIFKHSVDWKAQTASDALQSKVFQQLETPPASAQLIQLPRTWVRAAAAVLLCITAFGLGRMSRSTNAGEELVVLQTEVQSLRTMMMMALIDKPRASERIRAVRMVEGLEQPALEAIELLIKAMNEDENINVRLASIEVLFAFKHLPEVQQALLRSLPRQDSPMVQMELLRMLREAEATIDNGALQKMLNDEQLDTGIRQQLQQLLKSI